VELLLNLRPGDARGGERKGFQNPTEAKPNQEEGNPNSAEGKQNHFFAA
jgi:hypothetical protein